MKKVDYIQECNKNNYMLEHNKNNPIQKLSQNIETLSYLQDKLSFVLREVAYQMRLDAFNESLNQSVDTTIDNALELSRRGDNPLTLVSVPPKD